MRAKPVPAAVACAVLLAISASPFAAPRSGGGGTCGATPSVSTVGSGSGGSFGVPALEGLGTPEISAPGSFSFRITGGVPGAPGVLILARREQPLFAPVFGTTIYTGSSGLAIPFTCDLQGVATLAPAPTSHPIGELCGLDLIAQATVFDFTAPGGAAWSNGLRFRFGTTPPGAP
jgi:hypothetical protein